MIRRPPRTLVVAWLLGLQLACLAAPAQAQDPEPATRVAALRFRRPTPGSGIETGGARILIHAPAAIVRKVLQRHDRYHRIFPRLEQSRVVTRKHGDTDVYLRAPILHGSFHLWAVLRFFAPRKIGLEEVIDSQLVDGNLDAWRASWRLVPCGQEQSFLEMELLADVKIPVPASLITPELEWVADRAVTAVRDRAECAYRSKRGGRRAADATPGTPTPPPTATAANVAAEAPTPTSSAPTPPPATPASSGGPRD